MSSRATMVLKPDEIRRLLEEQDPILTTTLVCPDSCPGRLKVDLLIVDNPATARHPMELQAVLVCPICGHATSASYYIHSPRDTAPRRG